MPPLSDDPCKDGSTELRSSGLPAEYRTVAPKSHMPTSAAKGPCAKCRNKSQQQGMKYIQPDVPASFKPEGRYKPPSYPLESGTIYKLSYPGVEGEMMKDCKPKAKSGNLDNIRPSNQPFAQDTTFRLSYTGVPGERSVSYKPLYRNMMGSGPMMSITTQRHDFVPKVSERQPPQKQNNNIHLSNAKMEDATTMSLSYQPVEGEKVASFKPQLAYRKSEYKLEQDTINRLSYQPWEPTPKEEFPWKKRDTYKPPVYTMEGHTIYRASYLPVENYERLPSFKPSHSMSSMGDRPFSSATIYKESYQDNGVPVRPEPVVRRENIYLSNQPMSQDTTARLSYTGVGGEKAVPCKPLYRNMMGAGPMQSVTTQRHDFIPKPIIPVESFKPRPAVTPSSYKMEDTTTFRASYVPNEAIPRPESFKPTSVYRKSPYPLESDTINRLSFQPYSPTPKEEYPWMKKARYQQPDRVMDGTSIYRGSYLAPGNYISDGSGGADEECDCQRQQTSATEDL